MTAHAGTFTAWVLAGPRLYSVPVLVPRTVYINSAAPASDACCQELGAPTVRTLPHGHQALHLFKVGFSVSCLGHMMWFPWLCRCCAACVSMMQRLC